MSIQQVTHTQTSGVAARLKTVAAVAVIICTVAITATVLGTAIDCQRLIRAKRESSYEKSDEI
jgi:hypothetical protein